jgi:hypothetical protein
MARSRVRSDPLNVGRGARGSTMRPAMTLENPAATMGSTPPTHSFAKTGMKPESTAEAKAAANPSRGFGGLSAVPADASAPKAPPALSRMLRLAELLGRRARGPKGAMRAGV